MEDVPNLINMSFKPIQIQTNMNVFGDYVCPSNSNFDKKRNLVVGSGAS